MKWTFRMTMPVVAVLAISTPAAADVWVENGDAGALPGTAQVTTGAGPLTLIRGTWGTPGDVDMFAIHVDGGGTFSATTEGLVDPLLDTRLYLFDASGRGVYMNDDTDDSSLQSTLPAHHPLTPTSPGLYYLAITDFTIDPLSTAGLIFPDGPFTGVLGPTGPGGGSPVSRWDGTGDVAPYAIALTGARFAVAAVPEPNSLALLCLGASCFLGYFWRRLMQGHPPRGDVPQAPCRCAGEPS